MAPQVCPRLPCTFPVLLIYYNAILFKKESQKISNMLILKKYSQYRIKVNFYTSPILI